MNNNFYTLFQYFTGRVSLHDNEFTFYSLFQNNNSLKDESTVIEKVGILLKQATFGCMVIFDEKKSYSPVEIERNRKFCIALFYAFTDCAAHISAFNTNFNNLLNSENEIKHFFAWIYLPSEKVIRCFNKNCIVKTNSNHTITSQQFFDIPITYLNYLAYAAHNFDLDSVTDAIESANESVYKFPVSYLKIVPKTALSENEKNCITKKFRFFYKIKELEFLGIKITDDEKYIKQFQHLKILEATKDNNLNSYFKEYFLNKKEIYVAAIDKQLNSTQLANSFDKIYTAILKNYKEDDQTHEQEHDLINELRDIWIPYTLPFINFKELVNTMDSWMKEVKNEKEAESKALILRENIDNILQLKQTIEKLEKTKLTPENKKTFDEQHKLIKSQMIFVDIVTYNEKLEELYNKNQTEYPKWEKDEEIRKKHRRAKILKITFIIGVLALIPILYNNYDYEIKDFFSNLFGNKENTMSNDLVEEVASTEVDPTNVPVVDSVAVNPKTNKPATDTTGTIKQFTNETITVYGETFKYTGKAILSYTGIYIPYQYGKAIFESGKMYVGDYRYGYRDGKGTMTFKNNDTYFGDFKKNKFEGNGTYTFAEEDADYYKGEFHDGTFHGTGAIYHKNGKKYQFGTYENGNLIKKK